MTKDDKIIAENGGDNEGGVTIDDDDGQSGPESDYESDPESEKCEGVTSSCTFGRLGCIVKRLNREQRVVVEEASFGNFLRRESPLVN